MSLIDALLAELHAEARTSRELLERVPEYQLGWRSTPEARTLGQQALQVATLPGAVAQLAATPTPARETAHPESATALISALDESVSVAARILGRMDDAALLAVWRLVHAEREVFSVPRGALLRSLMLDHWRNERAQLALQLRALGVVVPARNGAAAETNPFAV